MKEINTISMSNDGEIAYKDTLTGDKFLEFIRERLILARELLADNGSIYLHIDYKIGYYIKIIMDEIFGIDNFKNDIAHIKCNPKNFNTKSYGNIKDLILFYSKTKNNIWNNPIENYTKEDIAELYKKVDSQGKLYTTVPLHAPGETKNGDTSQCFKGLYLLKEDTGGVLQKN
ncbi:MAG: site-specific DNA-methyltransferase [Endomicrobium sp.]|jgi:adenine-specific DNA-methyltransferase|nr:site-specific DNA-methyltransferase [Endomicrobium sp.]